MLNYTYGGSTENCWPAVVYTYFKLWMLQLHLLELEIKRSVLAETGTSIYSDPCRGFRAVRADDLVFWGPCLFRYRFEFHERRLLVMSLHITSLTVS
jgi:hypothetical protein